MRKFFLIVLAAIISTPLRADPVIISDAERPNWLAVGRVNLGGFKSKALCSGVLIAPSLVLTAAHCVANPKTGTPYPLYKFRFVAGWHRGAHSGVGEARAVHLHPDYSDQGRGPFAKIATDIALVSLKEPINGVTPLPINLSDTPFKEGPIRMLGYRSDRQHALTDYQGCSAYVYSQRMLSIDCDVVQGTSGAPVFGMRGGVWEVVGVVSSRLEKRGRDKALAPLVGALRAIPADVLSDILPVAVETSNP